MQMSGIMPDIFCLENFIIKSKAIIFILTINNLFYLVYGIFKTHPLSKFTFTHLDAIHV